METVLSLEMALLSPVSSETASLCFEMASLSSETASLSSETGSLSSETGSLVLVFPWWREGVVEWRRRSGNSVVRVCHNSQSQLYMQSKSRYILQSATSINPQSRRITQPSIITRT